MEGGTRQPEPLEVESVGIDIGSSTSSLMFSSLTLGRADASPETRLEVIHRAITFRSDIMLTPFVEGSRMVDIDALSGFLEGAYLRAGKRPADVETGAVIITGEAASRENAESIVKLLSERSGKFVCAVAGPNMEAALAAHGSGAVERSFSAPHSHGGAEHRHPRMVMNVDIGGGTTKVALAYGGRVIFTSSLSVGARLIAFGREGAVERIEGAARTVARACGLPEPRRGEPLPSGYQVALTAALADALFSIIDPTREATQLARQLTVTQGDAKPPYRKIDVVLVSGGVSEFVYRRSRADYGDLGLTLADAIRERLLSGGFGIPLEEPDEYIRATAIGASQYTFQTSGNTVFISDENLLPVRNAPVCILEIEDRKEVEPPTIRGMLVQALKGLDYGIPTGMVRPGVPPCAIAIRCPILGYEGTKKLALGVKDALSFALPPGLPVILVSKENLGASLGKILTDELGVQTGVVSIDELDLSELDYVDVGSRIPGTGAVPVTVKSLVFRSHARQKPLPLPEHSHDHSGGG